MKAVDYAARQMIGAWEMAFDLRGWKSSLDRSADAVFASFSAMAIVLPVTVLQTISIKRAAIRHADFNAALYREAEIFPLIVGDIMTTLISWGAALALLVALARAMGVAKNAAVLIVGYNWVLPIIAAANAAPVILLGSTGARITAGILAVPALALSLTLVWGVVRRGLEARPAPAIAIVIMLVLVTTLLELLCEGAMGAILAHQS